ncbi:ABC transporter ATP-binding protein [bacterium]|nr:ABC transporter ATP-binding protein [bacterium]
MTVIKAESASFAYPDGTQALHQISTAIDSGEFAAVIGPNGAGKTTLARLLCGILAPQSGKVWIDGWDTSQFPASRLASKVGYVFADPRLQIFTSSVREETAFGPNNLGFSPSETEAAVSEALQVTGLQDKASAHPYDLSYSERRLLALASVIAMRQQAIVMDEPTAGLDGPARRQLQNALALLRRRGTAAIIISHDMDFVADCCARVLGLKDGRLIADGPCSDVLARAELFGQELPCAARLCRASGLPAAYSAEEFVAALQ